jgi:hypothetical protein
MSKSVYSTREAFDIYVYFLALKKHFTTNYDFFKYNGKIKASLYSFENRKDKFFFYKLSKRSDARQFILANILENSKVWIGDLFDEKHEEVYKQWIKVQQSLGYRFRNDVSKLDQDDPNRDIIVTDSQHPRLFKLYLQNEITIETLIILNDLIDFFPHWEKKISDTILFPEINKKCRDYQPFLQYDKEKMRKIVLDKYKHIA